MFKYIKIDLQSILYSLVWVVILSAILSACIYFTPLSERHNALFSALILAYSVIRGGKFAASKIRRNGLLHGLRVGILAFVLTTIASMLVRHSFLSFSDMLPTLILLLAAGGLGGIIGVNKAAAVRSSRSSEEDSAIIQ